MSLISYWHWDPVKLIHRFSIIRFFRNSILQCIAVLTALNSNKVFACAVVLEDHLWTPVGGNVLPSMPFEDTVVFPSVHVFLGCISVNIFQFTTLRWMLMQYYSTVHQDDLNHNASLLSTLQNVSLWSYWWWSCYRCCCWKFLYEVS